MICSNALPPATPTLTASPTSLSAASGDNIPLLCSWDTSVYYVAWYKGSALLYQEDLATPSVLMVPPQGITIHSDFAMMMSALTIDNAAMVNSGSYTCAVTCGAKRVEFGMIPGNLQDTVEVFVHSK